MSRAAPEAAPSEPGETRAGEAVGLPVCTGATETTGPDVCALRCQSRDAQPGKAADLGQSWWEAGRPSGSTVRGL